MKSVHEGITYNLSTSSLIYQHGFIVIGADSTSTSVPERDSCVRTVAPSLSVRSPLPVEHSEASVTAASSPTAEAMSLLHSGDSPTISNARDVSRATETRSLVHASGPSLSALNAPPSLPITHDQIANDASIPPRSYSTVVVGASAVPCVPSVPVNTQSSVSLCRVHPLTPVSSIAYYYSSVASTAVECNVTASDLRGVPRLSGGIDQNMSEILTHSRVVVGLVARRKNIDDEAFADRVALNHVPLIATIAGLKLVEQVMTK